MKGGENTLLPLAAPPSTSAVPADTRAGTAVGGQGFPCTRDTKSETSRQYLVGWEGGMGGMGGGEGEVEGEAWDGMGEEVEGEGWGVRKGGRWEK